jgi:hypothetical protein
MLDRLAEVPSVALTMNVPADQRMALSGLPSTPCKVGCGSLPTPPTLTLQRHGVVVRTRRTQAPATTRSSSCVRQLPTCCRRRCRPPRTARSRWTSAGRSRKDGEDGPLPGLARQPLQGGGLRGGGAKVQQHHPGGGPAGRARWRRCGRPPGGHWRRTAGPHPKAAAISPPRRRGHAPSPPSASPSSFVAITRHSTAMMMALLWLIQSLRPASSSADRFPIPT